VQQKQNFAGDVVATHNDLYQLYEGQNLYLRDTILGFILDEKEWYTSVIPWFETDEMNIAFNIFEFQNTLATIVPNEGVSRLISFNKRGYEDSVQRMGIAFVMEGDLVGSYAGSLAYKRNIAGISQCCQETVNFHTVVKLLTCKDAMREMQSLHRNGDSKTLQKIEADQIADFAVLAYDRDGFIRMVERGREVIRQSKGVADTLIVFPSFPYFNDMVSHAIYTEYYKTGPNGVQLLTEGPASNGSFRGIPVYETRGYSVYNDGINFQPLLRRVAVGEFYAVTFDWRGQPISPNYRSDHRSIYVYSLEADEYEKVTFASIFQHANIYGGDETDPGGLSPQTDALVTAANQAFERQGGFDDAQKRYGSFEALEKLDMVSSGIPSNRKLYMMLAHDVQRKRVAKARTLGELDVDVVTTKDFEDVAQSIVNKMFAPAGDEVDLVRTALDKGDRFARRLEAVPYNDAYFRALAYENRNASVTANGLFVGYQRDDQSPIMWYQNAFNALDLPVRTAASLWTMPVGAVSYGWSKTISTQGLARGYSQELVDAAAEQVRVIDRVVARQADTMPESYAFLLDRAPWWLQSPTPEDVMFAALYHQRPPMLLGVPESTAFRGEAATSGAVETRAAGVPTRAARVQTEQQRQQQELGANTRLMWTPIIDANQGALVLPTTLPELRRIDVMVRALRFQRGVPEFNVTDNALWVDTRATDETALDQFLLGVLRSYTDINASEEARKRILNALKALLNTSEAVPGDGGDANYAVASLTAVQTLVNAITLPTVNAGDNANDVYVAAVDALLERINKSIAETSARIRAERASNAPVSQAVREAGEAILQFQNGARPVNIVNPGGDGTQRVVPMRAELQEAINAHVLAPVSEKISMSNGATLERLEENFDALGRANYAPSDAMLLSLHSYPQWKLTAKAKGMKKSASAAITKAYNDYVTLSNDLQEQVVEVHNQKLRSLPAQAVSSISAASASSTSSNANIGSSMLRAGDEVPRDLSAAAFTNANQPPKVWFLSPVTNSPALQRSLMSAEFSKALPMVLPTDKNSDYRTAILPWSVKRADGTEERADVPANSVNRQILAHIMSDKSMQPITSDMTLADVKPLHNEAWVRAKRLHTPIAATFFSTQPELMAEYRDAVPVGLVGSQLNDALDLNAIRAQAREEALRSGIVYGEEEDEAVMAAINSRNEARAAAGLPARDYTADFTRAASDSRQAEASGRAAVARAAALSSMKPLQSGAREFGDSTLSVIAMENARAFSLTQQSTGVNIKTPAQIASERRARLAGVAPPTEQFDVFAPNREFVTRQRDFEDRYNDNVDAMAEDQLPELTPEERRQRAYLDHVGYDLFEQQDERGRFMPASQRARMRLASFGYTKHAEPQNTDAYLDSVHLNTAYRFEKANKQRDPLVRLAMIAVLFTNNSYEAIYNMIAQNVHVPLNFIVWRLFIELEMFTCILLQSGIETGANVLGHTNMVFSNTSADKMMHGHFTYHHATMIWNQQFVHHLTDVMPAGYIAGWDTDFVMGTDELTEDDRGSIIVTPIPITETLNGARKLCFIRTNTQRLLPSVTNRPKNQRSINDYSSAGMSELTWKLSEAALAYGNTGQVWGDSSVRINVMAWRGTWWSYNPSDQYFSKKNHGHGHLSGNRTGPGVRKVFIGSGNGFCDDQRLMDQSLRLQ